jgi:hypothetical protein
MKKTISYSPLLAAVACGNAFCHGLINTWRILRLEAGRGRSEAEAEMRGKMPTSQPAPPIFDLLTIIYYRTAAEHQTTATRWAGKIIKKKIMVL